MNKSETQTWWVVQVFRQWSSLQVLGLPLGRYQEPGMVGFLPVFDSIEAARAWRDEGHPNAGIVSMTLARRS